MGLMTSLLIGGALGAGMFAGKKLAGGKQQQQQQQQAPMPASPLAQPAPPPIDPSGNQVKANQAGKKTRARAAGATLLGTPSSTPAPTAAGRPKTLIGY